VVSFPAASRTAWSSPADANRPPRSSHDPSVRAIVEAIQSYAFSDLLGYDDATTKAVRDVLARDPQLVRKIMTAMDEAPYVERMKLMRALGILQMDAAEAAPKLVDIVMAHVSDKTDEGQNTLGMARLASQKMGPRAANAYAGFVRNGTPAQARLALTTLRDQRMGLEGLDALQPLVPVVHQRVKAAVESGDVLEVLIWIETLSPGGSSILRDSEAGRAAQPIILAAAESNNDPNVRTRAVAAMPAIGIPAKQGIPIALRHYVRVDRENPDVRKQNGLYVPVLYAYRGEAVEPLTQLARYAKDAAEREAALELLIYQDPLRRRPQPRVKNPDSILLESLAKDLSPQVRQTAARLLGALKARSPDALKGLELAAKEDLDPAVRASATEVLANLKQP
jgi:hypothetical protein